MKILPEEVVVSPARSMDMLSQLEVSTLREKGHGGLHETFRRCALAVLNVAVKWTAPGRYSRRSAISRWS